MIDYAAKLTELKKDLETYKSARKQLISTGQSVQIRNGDDNRSITFVSLGQLNELITKTEKQIAELEGYVGSDGTIKRNPKGIRVGASIL